MLGARDSRGYTLRLLTFTTLVVAVGPATAVSQTYTWSGPDGGVWSTASNWSPQTVPNASGVVASFDSSGSASAIVDGTFTIGELTFATGATPLLVSGTGTSAGLTFDNGAFSPVIRITGTSGIATIDVALTIAGNNHLTLNIARGSSSIYPGLFVESAISGSGTAGITVTGGGVVVATGANSYTGQTTLTDGVFRANEGQGLPSGSNLSLRGIGTTSGGVGTLESIGNATLTRTIGAGPGQIQFVGDGTGALSAHGGTLTVRLNNGEKLSWSSNGLNSGFYDLAFGSRSFNGVVDYQNGLDLGGEHRICWVFTPLLGDAGVVRMSGVLENGGMTFAGTRGRVELIAANTHSGTTEIGSGIVLRAQEGVGLPTASRLNLYFGSVFESAGGATFTRSLGTAAGQVDLSQGGGGFSAYGGLLTVQLNNGTDTLTWGQTQFVPVGSRLVFGSAYADSIVDFQNGLNMNGNPGTILVNDNPNVATDHARISGVISNGGLRKEGPGSLELTAENTFAGGTVVIAGRLLVNNTGTPGLGVSSGTGLGSLSVQAGAELAGSGRIEIVNAVAAFAPGSRLAPGGGQDNSLRIETNGTDSGANFDGTWAVRLSAAGAAGVADNSGGSTAGAIPDPSNHTFLDLDATSGGPGDFNFTLTSWEVDGTGVAFELGQRYSYRIGRALGPDAIVNGPLNVTDPSRFASVGFDAIDWSLTSDAGGAIYVNFTPVPEPGAILLFAAASFWMARQVASLRQRSTNTVTQSGDRGTLRR